MAASTSIIKLQNGNVQVQRGSEFYSLNPDAQTFRKVATDKVAEHVHIKDKSSSRLDEYFVADIIQLVRRDGTVIASPDLDTLYFELANFFFFKLGSGGANHLGVFDNYTDLITQYPTAATGDLAYVENSQGTFWLPGTMGGNFYSKGPYLYNGTFWDSAVDEIAKQLEENTNDIFSLQQALTNHVNDLANPHDTTISNLIDTTITGAINGEVLTFSGGQWINDSPAVGVPSFVAQVFNVTSGSLPIVSAATDNLNIDFTNFNADIDLTGQLPINLNTGARVTLRKNDADKKFRIIYDDGVKIYNFMNKEGEYLTLYWNGTKYII